MPAHPAQPVSRHRAARPARLGSRQITPVALALVGAVLALAGCQLQSTGSWEALQMPPGNTVYAMAVDPHAPNLFYAGTSTGNVFRARIESTGTAPGTGIPGDAAVAALAVDPIHAGSVYAGTSRGVYATSNYGDNWHARRSGLPADDGVFALAFGATTGDHATLYGGTDAHGVYASQDGATWQASSTGLPSNARVLALLYEPSTKTLYAALAGNGLYASTDAGQTWAARGSGLPAHADTLVLLSLPSSSAASASRTLFAGTDQGVFASDDGGQTWHAAGLSQKRVLALAAEPTKGATLYAGTDDNVSQSADGGKTWVAVAPGIPQAVNAVVALADQNHRPVVFAGTTQILRYPAVAGSSGGLGTILSVVVFLLLAGLLLYTLRRSRRMVEGMTQPPTPRAGTELPDTPSSPNGYRRGGPDATRGTPGQRGDTGPRPPQRPDPS